MLKIASAVGLACIAGPVASAQQVVPAAWTRAASDSNAALVLNPAAEGESSSVVAEPAGEAAQAAGHRSRRSWRDVVPVYEHPVRPFSEFGMAMKASTLGLGVDFVTPLLRKWNLRGSANFIDFGLTVPHQGVNYNGEFHMRSGQVSLDYYPMTGGFHITPGLLIFNPRIAGGISIPGGNTYTIEDQTFTSDATDPVHGDAKLAFDRRFMPSLAIGFGNIIPRSGKRLTVPIEVGVAYMGHSTVSIALAGTACQQGSCSDVASDPASQNDLREQINDINETLKRVQVLPFVSIGIGYRF